MLIGCKNFFVEECEVGKVVLVMGCVGVMEGVIFFVVVDLLCVILFIMVGFVCGVVMVVLFGV